MKASTQTLLLQLKALGDPTRLRLVALCQQGECSVSELTQVLGLSQPRVSQQLKQLCDVGLLDRFRDGKRVFYRVPGNRAASAALLQLLALIPAGDPEFESDRKLLRQRRVRRVDETDTKPRDDSADRALHRVILDLTVTAPIGHLLDVGCGRGAILKLLASRASRVVGVDIDASARQLARAELLLAGIPNCCAKAICTDCRSRIRNSIRS